MGDFNVEGFQEHLNTDEGKQWFDSFVKGLGFRSATEHEGVANKNKELLGTIKKLKEGAIDTDEALSRIESFKDNLKELELGIDLDGNIDYDGIELLLSRSKDNDNPQPEVDELQRNLKKSQREFEKSSKMIASLTDQLAKSGQEVVKRESAIAKLLIDGEFKKVLAEAGYGKYVVPNILPSLRDKSKAEIVQNEDTGEFSAIVDDGGNIESWVDTWKETDEGKALRLAPLNSGGGSHGGANNVVTTKKWSDMTGKERTDLFNQNPALYRKLKVAKD